MSIAYPETFCSRKASELDDVQVAEMASLFSAHYGRWGSRGPKPGEAVRMSAPRLRADFLFDDSITVVLAKLEGKLVGHVFYKQFEISTGSGIWITQLVVDAAMRSRKIASRLLGIAVSHARSLKVCAMATSHPHAVKALENAAGSQCTPSVADLLAEKVLAACGVPYVQGKKLRVSEVPASSVIDTGFFVDHTEVDALRASIPDWRLGELREGEEFLAIALRGISACMV